MSIESAHMQRFTPSIGGDVSDNEQLVDLLRQMVLWIRYPHGYDKIVLHVHYQQDSQHGNVLIVYYVKGDQG